MFTSLFSFWKAVESGICGLLCASSDVCRSQMCAEVISFKLPCVAPESRKPRSRLLAKMERESLICASDVLPLKLKQVALQILRSVVDTKQTLDHVEFFAGFANVTREFKDAGYVALSYEVTQGRVYQNLLTDAGFLAACAYVLKLKPGGSLLLAPVCSSWVTINRGTSLRSPSNPLGNTDLQYIRDANQMVRFTNNPHRPIATSTFQPYCLSSCTVNPLQSNASSMLQPHSLNSPRPAPTPEPYSVLLC